MARVLVLGAGGMLGHKLCQLLPRSGYEVFGAIRGGTEPDASSHWAYRDVRLVRDIDVIREGCLEELLATLQPDWIINCVGVVKQHGDAGNRFLSVSINALLPHRLARLAATRGAHVIHVSTDCVFSGTVGRYGDDDHSDAIDLYGKSKYLGETDSSEANAITLRTSIIGRELRRPFHGLLEWFLGNRGGAVRGFAKAIYSGFTTQELCRIMERLMTAPRRLSGTWNVASSAISKYELLRLINRVYGLGIAVERDTDFVCDRSLRMAGFAELTGYQAPEWAEMIESMYVADSNSADYQS